MAPKKALIPVLLVVLAAEAIAVHALIEHALKAGTDALNTWHDITGDPK